MVQSPTVFNPSCSTQRVTAAVPLCMRAVRLALLVLLLSPACTMRLVLQRVKSASVTVNNQQISSIGNGVLALVGLHQNDSAEDLAYCAKKLLGCKLWANDEGKAWRKSVKQMEYDVLLVSQFTLLGTIANKKHSPDFKLSMKPDEARAQYEAFKSLVSAGHDASRVYDGEFGAMMDVSLVNDGPVTLVVDSVVLGESDAGGSSAGGSREG